MATLTNPEPPPLEELKLETAEFSFPISAETTSGQNSFIDSPPLWQPTITSSNNITSNTDSNSKKKSLSNTEAAAERVILNYGKLLISNMEKDDQSVMMKMDLLWEDFNEDRIINSRRKEYYCRSSLDNDYYSASSSLDSSMSKVSDELVEFGCVGSVLKGSFSGDSGNNSSKKKQAGVAVVVKVLRKCFLLQ